ncbi:MAG: hypothetical protein K8F91_18390 [Candidatus Obscuribacterales bacterium]|nr:hypothetical protein [Candidatus Obscuribacterales bacterium]
MVRSETERHVQTIARNLLPEDREAVAKMIDDRLAIENKEDCLRWLSVCAAVSDMSAKATYLRGWKDSVTLRGVYETTY